MIGNFEQCLKWLLVHEGGYVNHPEDPGGRTNMGITAAVYEEWLGTYVTEGDMRSMPVHHAAAIYKKNYWDKIKGDDLPAGLDWAVFDWAVNSGPGRSARAIQKIVQVKPDGAIGPKTLAAIASHDTASMIDDMYSRRQAFYQRLKTFDTFGKGWTRRNDETREQAHSLVA